MKKYAVLGLFLLLFGWTITASAETWVLYPSESKDERNVKNQCGGFGCTLDYYDRDSVKKMGNGIVSLRTKNVHTPGSPAQYTKPQKLEVGINIMEIDCFKDKLNIVKLVVYEDGAVTRNEDYATEWRVYPHSGFFDWVKGQVCR